MAITRLEESQVHIVIDGKLDEPVWNTLPYHDDMVVIEPDTLSNVPLETRARFFYTNKGFYIGIWSEQDAGTLISRLSSRDQFVARDDVGFTLDPSGRGLYAYWFGVNLGGTLQDGTVLPERQYSSQWDGPWSGASAIAEGGWSAEFFLPWSMMTMPDTDGESREMGFYMSRNVAYLNERWAFPGLPRTKPVFLSQLQKIRIDGVAPTQQFTFYPYASATYDNTEATAKDSYKAGFDVFWRPSTNLQLTATVNPDFGNVESDDVVVNLSSFETFFPEKRPFFLEGNEIFVTTSRARQGRHGRGDPTTLLNTRRIGSPPRDPEIAGFELTGVEENQPTELIGAAKATGQSGKFRYGLLGAFEDDTVLHGELGGIPFDYLQHGRDFGVARVLFEDTSAGGRRSIGWMSTMVAHPQGDAIAHGLDGHYLSPTGRWNLEGQLLRSDVSDVTGNGGFVDVTYTPARGYEHTVAFDYFDDTLDIDDLGFLRRNDSVGARYGFVRTESDLESLVSRETSVRLVQDYNTDGKPIRSGIFFGQDRQFRSNTRLSTELNYFPARWDDINSDGNGSFRIRDRWVGGMFVGTDEARKLFAGFGAFFAGEDLGGESHEIELELAWRPNDRIAALLNLRYENKRGWLIHHDGRDFTTFAAENWRPRIEADFFLTAHQQFRITAQWAGIKAFEQDRWQVPVPDGDLLPVAVNPGDSPRDFSISRLTFQARYRWEIAPLSDLYVVYTRGSDVDSRPEDGFHRLLKSSWTEPLVDVFVIKLRYRLGS